MQSTKRKKYLILCLFFLSINLTFSKSDRELLEESDNFFQEKKYLQALDGYEELIQGRRVVSEKVLVRLMWISNHENLTDRAIKYASILQSRYPLNGYTETLNKLTDENDLDRHFGNTKSQFSFLWSKVGNYYLFACLGFFIVALALIVIHFNKEGNKRYIALSVVILCLFAGGYILPTLFHQKFYTALSEDIFYTNPNYLSLQVKDKVRPGDQLIVLDEDNVWVKVTNYSDTLFLPKTNDPLVY